MVIAVDFDGTVVSGARRYDDVTTPLSLLPGAREGLLALGRAGHVLLLYSARASRALLDDPELDPLVRAGALRADRAGWERMRAVHRARYWQMVAFVRAELPGVFAAVDDGRQGKPASVDLFIDDKALRLGRGTGGYGWEAVARMYGEPDLGPRLKAVTGGR